MATIRTDDDIELYVDEAGSGVPIVFVHEFAGDHRSWEPQMRHFARRYRCITYGARGYLPSAVPPGPERYSQDRMRDDLLAVLDGMSIERAHIVGCSMGAFAALHFGMAYCTAAPTARALSLTLVGCGSGAHPALYGPFKQASLDRAVGIRRDGMAGFAASYGYGPVRLQYLQKDPRGFAEFQSQLIEHSAVGSANVMEGCLARRPCLYDLTDRMAAIDVPVLIVTGDEDDQCLEPALLMKRVMANSGLAIVPKTGHAVNLEEPQRFNRLLDDFVHDVGLGRWPVRDLRTRPDSIWGPAGEPVRSPA